MELLSPENAKNGCGEMPLKLKSGGRRRKVVVVTFGDGIVGDVGVDGSCRRIPCINGNTERRAKEKREWRKMGG